MYPCTWRGRSSRYRTIATGMECSSADTSVGKAPDVDACAELVKRNHGDTIYGVGGKVLRAVYFVVRLCAPPCV